MDAAAADVLRRAVPVVDDTGAADPEPNPNPPTIAPAMSGVVWFMTGTALVFLVLRLYGKHLKGKGFWWDDYVLGAAWHMFLLASVCMSLMVRFDYGRHSQDIPFEHLSPILFLMILEGFFSILAAAWSKTSFAVTLLRLAGSSPGRWNTACLWFIIVTVNAVLGTAAVITWAQCDPVDINWKPWTVKQGNCMNNWVVVRLMQASAVYSGVADMVLAFMPWVMLWKANMSARAKYGVLCAMSMSVFAGIASFIKASAFPSIVTGDLMDGSRLIMLTAAEIAVTIMAASVPVMRTLWARKGETSTRGSSGSNRRPSNPQPPSPPPSTPPPMASNGAEVAPAPSMYARISRDMDTVVGKMDTFSSSTVNLTKVPDEKGPKRTLC